MIIYIHNSIYIYIYICIYKYIRDLGEAGRDDAAVLVRLGRHPEQPLRV